MTSGVPKKYHGGTLGVPQWYRSTAGWVFPLHTTHCYSKTTVFRDGQGWDNGYGLRTTVPTMTKGNRSD